MTGTPAWPPPIGTTVYLGAECPHAKWGEIPIEWDGKPRKYSVTCPDGCTPTATARWTEPDTD